VLAWVEALIALGIWLALGAWIGPLGFLLVYVLPLVVGNVVVMAHIVTNHSLSPLADENDPLTTTLTVTVPRWFSFYTLGFGYHVEHHLFPSMSHRHGPLVAQHLRHMAPDRYQEMPLLAALRLMFSTPRVYENHTTLYDPATGERAPALGSRPVFIPLAGDVEEFDRGRRRSRAAVPALSDPDPRGEWQWLSGAMPDGPRHSSIPPPPPA
jgi:fatty acid desaturase